MSSLPRIASHAESSAVVEVTDVPGKWFDPSVTVVPVGGSVEFRTTTFGATFTSAIFPCTPDSLTPPGTCGLDNPASFPSGFPVDQPDPIVGTKTVTFPVAGVYVFADKVHPYAVGVVVASDADHPLTAKQQALLEFAGQNQLF